MKKLILFSLMAWAIIPGCSQNPEKVLENETDRHQIMEVIAENPEYMSEMMTYMMGSDHAMNMMRGNYQIMSSMMMGDSVGMMMRQHPEMMEMMMGHMMTNCEYDSSYCIRMGDMMMENMHMRQMMHDRINRQDMDHRNMDQKMEHMQMHRND